MKKMKAFRQFAHLAALSVAGVALLANNARAAVITYNLDVNGASQVPSNFGITTGSTYDWDDTANGGFWSNNSSTVGNIATNGWVQGNFPKFQPSGTPTYVVTVSNVEQVAGMFFSTAQNLTINATGAGALDMVTGIQGVLGSGSADVTINAPITGVGEPQFSNGGNIRLNGTNTYTGGTNLSSTSTLIHFNNSSSFGPNFINMGVAGFAPLLASGGATVTLPNNFTTSVIGAGVNFAADANTPVVSTGTWTLGANNLVLRNNGGSASATLTLSNVISGGASVTLSSNFNDTIIFSGPNLYTGTTTVGGLGTNSSTGIVKLKLGAANTIATSSSVIMTGGTLDPGGFNQAMSSTTLALLGTTSTISTIDYIAGASEVDFANSSAIAWTAGKILNLANWDFATTKLRFGTDSTGLTASQLSQIQFNGSGLGTAQLDPNGYVVIPEPSSALLLLIGGIAMRTRRRRPA